MLLGLSIRERCFGQFPDFGIPADIRFNSKAVISCIESQDVCINNFYVAFEGKTENGVYYIHAHMRDFE